jgi:hypothetical protein
MDGVVVGRFRVWPLAVRLSAGTDLEHGYRPGHAAIQIQTPGVESEGRRSEGMSVESWSLNSNAAKSWLERDPDGIWVLRSDYEASEQQCAALIASEAHARERISELENTLEKAQDHIRCLESITPAATFPERFAVWKALGFPDGHEGDLVAAARKLKEDHDSLAETATDADNELAEAVKERNALRVVLEMFMEKWPTVENAVNGALMFQHIHGMPYNGPTLEAELTAMRAALATPAPEPSQPFECPMCAPGTCPGGAHVSALWGDGIRTREQYAAMVEKSKSPTPAPEKQP